LAPLGGGFADHHDKRRILFITQTVMMLFAVALGLLTLFGVVRFWMILAITVAGSAALSFDQPARNALAVSLVPQESLMNAISLQSVIFNGASMLGPALAGITLSHFGYAANFFLNGVSFLAVIVALLLLDKHAIQSHPRPQGGLLQSIRDALHFVRRDPILPSVVSGYAALLFLGPSVILTVPIFTRQILHAGPSQLGWLFSAVGSGTVAGALLLASLGDPGHKDRLAIGSMLLGTLALAAFGWAGIFSYGAVSLFVFGIAQNAAGATTMTLLQTRVPPEMRGRAMSLNTLLVMCIRPLGDFPAGAVMGWLGFRNSMLASATAIGLILLIILAIRATSPPLARPSQSP